MLEQIIAIYLFNVLLAVFLYITFSRFDGITPEDYTAEDWQRLRIWGVFVLPVYVILLLRLLSFIVGACIAFGFWAWDELWKERHLPKWITSSDLEDVPH